MENDHKKSSNETVLWCAWVLRVLSFTWFFEVCAAIRRDHVCVGAEWVQGGGSGVLFRGDFFRVPSSLWRVGRSKPLHFNDQA